MHMKYMFLFYKTGRLRVVVSTANLIPLDWKGLENCVFIQDVALHSSSGVVGNNFSVGKTKQTKEGSKAEESFAVLLQTVLKATNVGPALESVKQRVWNIFYSTYDLRVFYILLILTASFWDMDPFQSCSR